MKSVWIYNSKRQANNLPFVSLQISANSSIPNILKNCGLEFFRLLSLDGI
jgi:hypothetical protein